MVTEASRQALDGLRDLNMMKWYAIPLLVIVLYIYMKEIHKARETGNWDPIYAGLTLFGMDFINETWNGMVFAATQHSAFWTTPGDTALRVMIGWNLEIIFMFSIAGIVYYYSLYEDRAKKILGLPNRWFLAIFFAAFALFVECLLNISGLLIWEYPWWNLSPWGVILIFLIGYFHFFVAIILVLRLKDDKQKKMAIGVIFAIAIILNVIFMGILGWIY